MNTNQELVVLELIQTITRRKKRLNELFQKKWLNVSQSEMQEKKFTNFFEPFISHPLADFLALFKIKLTSIYLVQKENNDLQSYPEKIEKSHFLYSHISSHIQYSEENKGSLPFKFYSMKESKEEKYFITTIKKEKKQSYQLVIVFHDSDFENKETVWNPLFTLLSDFVHEQLGNWKGFLSIRFRETGFSSFESKETELISLQLHNFRAFQDTEEVELKPITIFIGPNSSGKSSILKSLLMLKHTQQQQSNNPHQLLITDEFHANLGNPEQFIHHGEVHCSVTITYKDLGQTPSTLSMTFEENEKRVVLAELDWRNSENQLNLKKGKENNQYELDLYYHKRGELFPSTIKEDVHLSETANLLLSLKSLCNQLEIPLIFPNFSSLHFLSSFREIPSRSYRNINPKRGILDYEGKNLVDYILTNKKLTEKKGESLINKINHWTKKFGFGQPLELATLDENVGKLALRLKGKSLDLIDVGLGINHILPIIAQGFLAKNTDTLIFENPELHLHPKAQGELAELFQEFLKDSEGKKLLIETHSEYLISRLRTLIGLLSKMCG